jgi:hypothetical protein
MDIAVVKRNDFSKLYKEIQEDYILIVDSDDEVNEATLRFLKDVDIDADIVVLDYVNRYQDKFKERKKANTYHVTSSQMVKPMLAGYYSATLRNKIFKKILFRDVDVSDDMGRYSDLALCVEIFQQNHKVLYVPEIISTRAIEGERKKKGIIGKMIDVVSTPEQLKEFDVFYKKMLTVLNDENKNFFYNITAKQKSAWVNSGLIRMIDFNRHAPLPLRILLKQPWSRKSIFYMMLSYLRK